MPTLSAGISDDDLALASVRGYAAYHDVSVANAIRDVGTQFSRERGGPFPLESLPVVFWALDPGPVIARLVQIAIVIADLALFVGLVGMLSKSWTLATLVGASTLLALQVRKPHDAIIGATLQIPLALGWVLAAAALYAYFLETGRRRGYLAALVFAGVATLTSEVGYLILAIVPLVYAASRRADLTSLCAMVAAPSASLAWVVISRTPPASVGWLEHADRADISRSFAGLVATIPSSYRSLGYLVRDGVPGSIDTRFETIPGLDILGIATVVVYLILVGVAASACERTPRVLPFTGAMMGLASSLWLVPAVFHDARAWRSGMPLGEGDTFTFIGCFGAGLGLALCLRTILTFENFPRQARALRVPLCAFVFTLVAYGNLRANDRIVELSRNAFEPTRLISSAGRSGVFENLGRGDAIALEHPSLPTTGNGYRNVRYLIAGAAGRPIDVTDIRRVGTAARPDRPNTWILRFERIGPMAGDLTLAHVSGATRDTAAVDRAIAFADGRGHRADLIASTRRSRRGIAIERTKITPSAATIVIRRTCGPVPLDSAFSANHSTIAYGGGFLPEAPYRMYQFARTSTLETRIDGRQTWRYGASRATLRIETTACPHMRSTLVATVYTSVPARLYIRTKAARLDTLASQMGTKIALPLARGRSNVDVTFETDAPAAPEALQFPPFDRRRFPPAHLLVVEPRIDDRIDASGTL